MTKLTRSLAIIGLASAMSLTAIPTFAAADTNQSIPQGVGSGVLNNTNYFGDLDPNTPVTIDIVMKLQNKNALAQFINQTTDPNSRNFRHYLSPTDFARQYAPSDAQVLAIVGYLKAFGIQSTVYPDHLIVTASGTAGQFNKAFSIVLKNATYHGKRFHATPQAPKAPSNIANDILCILGLSNYSDFHSNAIKRVDNGDTSTPTGPLNLTPQDLVSHYHVQPLYDKGATGAGQTIGIVTLADFNEQDAYDFWNQMGIHVKPSRITKVNVDGGSDWNGYDETSLDVEQSGALAPQANIRVYVAPNSDTGFVDGFSKAINDNQAQQISVSWEKVRRPSVISSSSSSRRQNMQRCSTNSTCRPLRRASPCSRQLEMKGPTTRCASSACRQAFQAPPPCRSTILRTARTSRRQEAQRCRSTSTPVLQGWTCAMMPNVPGDGITSGSTSTRAA